MAVARTNLLAVFNSANQTSYTTASFTITSGRPVIVAVISNFSNPPTTPTITASSHGSTYTWTQEATQYQSTSTSSLRRRITVFSTHPTSTNSGTLTFDFGSDTQENCTWFVEEFTGAHATDIVRQTATAEGVGSGTVEATLAAFGSTDNATLGYFAINNTTATLTLGTGFTESSMTTSSPDAGPTRGLAEFRVDNDTSVTAEISGTTGRAWVGIALELRIVESGNVTALTGEGTGDALVPVITVNLVSDEGVGTGDALVPALPAVLTPVGRLGMPGAILGYLVLGEPGIAGNITIGSLTGTGTGEATVPTLSVSHAAVAALGADEVPEFFIGVEISTFSFGGGTGDALAPVHSVVIPLITATGTGDGIAPTFQSGAFIPAVSSGGFADALVPLVTIAEAWVVATATGDAFTPSLLAFEWPSAVATGTGDAPVPQVGSLEIVTAGELDFRAFLVERLNLEAQEREDAVLGSRLRERAMLDALDTEEL